MFRCGISILTVYSRAGGCWDTGCDGCCRGRDKGRRCAFLGKDAGISSATSSCWASCCFCLLEDVVSRVGFDVSVGWNAYGSGWGEWGQGRELYRDTYSWLQCFNLSCVRQCGRLIEIGSKALLSVSIYTLHTKTRKCLKRQLSSEPWNTRPDDLIRSHLHQLIVMFQVQVICHYPRLSISTAVLPTPHEYEGQHEEFGKLELELAFVWDILHDSRSYFVGFFWCIATWPMMLNLLGKVADW